MRAYEIALMLCPNAKPSYLAALDAGDELLARCGINTEPRLSMFLAQIFHESGGLAIEWESGNYSEQRLLEIFGVGHHSAAVTPSEARVLAHNGPAIFERVYGLGNPKKACELGNNKPGDGWKFRGGGLMQTTGKDNYRRIGQKMKPPADLTKNPELVLSTKYALQPALIEWSEGHLNDYADRGDFLAISRKINVGNINTTKIPNGYSDRKQWLSRIRSLSDIPDEPLLAKGSKGDAVVELQNALNHNGAMLVTDGDFGELTRQAVIKFQIDHNLLADGKVGPSTWAVLA